MALIKLTPEDVQFTETIKYIQGNLNDITTITPMLIEAICEAVEYGATYETAATSVGIHPQTLINWFKRGNSLIAKERTPLTELFAKKLAMAMAKREIRSLHRLDKAAEGGYVIEETRTISPNGQERVTRKYATPNVQADMWYLERKYPEKWGKSTHTTVDITHTIKQYTDDELDLKIKEIVDNTQGQI